MLHQWRILLLIILIVCAISGIWFLYTEIYISQPLESEKAIFEIKPNESILELSARLEKEGIIRNAWLFRKYLVFKGLDKKINYGAFEVQSPITIQKVAQALSQPGISERTTTLIPGWTINDFADYLEKSEIATGEELKMLVGSPAVNYKVSAIKAPQIEMDLKILKDKPWYVSYEGFFAPETYRIYRNATVQDIVIKLMEQREKQITNELWKDIEKSGHSFFEILTMASILEKEVSGDKDRKIVADIFWRRFDLNWALQADSTVHYAVGKTGEVFTTSEDRDSTSPWNTYKYPGLPIGPICNPSLDAIKAAIYPEANDYWYFLTTNTGEVKYAKTLGEHGQNKAKYL